MAAAKAKPEAQLKPVSHCDSPLRQAGSAASATARSAPAAPPTTSPTTAFHKRLPACARRRGRVTTVTSGSSSSSIAASLAVILTGSVLSGSNKTSSEDIGSEDTDSPSISEDTSPSISNATGSSVVMDRLASLTSSLASAPRSPTRSAAPRGPRQNTQSARVFVAPTDTSSMRTTEHAACRLIRTGFWALTGTSRNSSRLNETAVRWHRPR
jgi:hypothetical protein